MGKARRLLIATLIAPQLDEQHQSISVRDSEFRTSFGHVDPGYLLDALGPGWTMQPFRYGGGVVFVRDISVQQAQAQIVQHLPPDKGS